MPVYVFNVAGAYLGLTDTTAAGGEASFRLPAGDYNFRADYLGNQYFSGNTTLIADQVNPVTVSTGGGNFTLTVRKATGEPMAGVACYLFSEDGAYLGHQSVTSAQGEASFELADGTYKIRVDYLGYPFWTEPFAIPAASVLSFDIPHQDTVVTVQHNYNGDIVAGENLQTYLFTAEGAYMGLNLATDAQGQVTFNLPAWDYKVRADFLGGRYWSEVFNQTDQVLVIHEGLASITVSQGSTLLANVPVYVFSSAGAYLGINASTDVDGVVEFILPEGTYKFRADYQGAQFWATYAVTAHQVNEVALNTGGGAFVLTVEKAAGVPLTGIPVYVFSPAGSYLSMTQQTDAQGQVSFDLSDGSYQFRADYFGYRFWSNVVTVPGMMSDVLTIAHQDVTVTVSEVYQSGFTPIEGINVYLFTSAGSYQGIKLQTDAQGQVTFNLPARDYKVRADYLGGQYWSEVFNATDAAVDSAHGYADVHITDTGSDIYDAPVYLFTEAGSYLGRMQRTDSAGMARFLIPAASYKFRVDYNGTQYWSDVINVLPYEETAVDLVLDLPAMDLTNDPDPVRFDGTPPKLERESVLLASLFDITGLLARSVFADTGDDDAVYYYINDHLGTPRIIIDESNNIVWRGDYQPFGSVNEVVSDLGNNFRFAGQYFDEETGLHYNYHRYYDPSTGRYLKPDPIGLEGGINLFSYAKLNPVNSVDPDGLEALVAPGVPLPIVPPPTPQQQVANQQLADVIWNSWQSYVDPALTAAGREGGQSLNSE